MRDEVAGLADELDRTFRGDAWHGPSLRAVLVDVDATSAAARPITPAHTIWELTLHAAVWMDVVRRRLQGEIVEPTDLEDWPPTGETSEQHWRDALYALDSAADRLLGAVRVLSPADLDRITPGKSHDNRLMLLGVIEHNLYHAGQIAVLRRALRG